MEFRALPATKAQSLARLKSDRHNRQLHDFLDRFLIQRAAIAGIGPAKTATLRSFGIESAADVHAGRIIQIPGFGPA
ncbi:hypothetical protein ABTM87_19715, partial [Acinetobacter baumannii]